MDAHCIGRVFAVHLQPALPLPHPPPTTTHHHHPHTHTTGLPISAYASTHRTRKSGCTADSACSRASGQPFCRPSAAIRRSHSFGWPSTDSTRERNSPTAVTGGAGGGTHCGQTGVRGPAEEGSFDHHGQPAPASSSERSQADGMRQASRQARGERKATSMHKQSNTVSSNPA